MIKYLDLLAINKCHELELSEAFRDVLNSGWYILGENVVQFEKNYAEFSKVNYSIGVANGLDALIISLKTLGIGPGDEVIVPSNTYIATWLAVSYVGALPIPVEPREDSCNIDPSRIEEKVSSKTKAILPVNLYGQAAELNKICDIAKRYNLYVVEDNAQAQGALCHGRPTGSWGHINATSFYPGKNLGAIGDAGAITTNDKIYDSVSRVIRNYGSEVKYYNERKGLNSRLDELQASLLLVKLKFLNAQNQERLELSYMYDYCLKEVGDIILPFTVNDCTTVHHIYQIRTSKRNELQAFLKSKGIETMIHYPIPPHLQKAYSELNFKKGEFPIAERIADTTLSLPLYPYMDKENIMKVIESIKLFY